jgi:hypothetical protein
MSLMVNHFLVAQEVLIHHFLQLEKGGRLVPTDISQVIRATAPQVHRLRIPVLLHIYLVECAVSIIPNAKDDRSREFIMLHQFNITNGMNLFPSSDYFVRSVGVNIFNQIRKGHSEKGNLQK